MLIFNIAVKGQAKLYTLTHTARIGVGTFRFLKKVRKIIYHTQTKIGLAVSGLIFLACITMGYTYSQRGMKHFQDYINFSI